MVARARRALGVRRVGHAGTLDPFATGLLIVLVGRATRLARFFVDCRRPTRSWPGSARPHHRRPRGRDRRRRAWCPALAAARPRAPAPARLLGRQGRWRARLRAAPAAARMWRRAEREVTVLRRQASSGATATAPRCAIVCSSGTYVRSLVAASATPTASSCAAADRPVRGRGRWPGRVPPGSLDIASAVGALRRDARARGGGGRALVGRRDGRSRRAARDGPALLLDARGQRAGDRTRARRRDCAVEVGVIAPSRERLGFFAPMRVTELQRRQPRPRTVAVGTFDGVHLGHRDVIAGSDTVLTFEPHPVAVIAPAHMPEAPDAAWIKADIIASLGVEELIVVALRRRLRRAAPPEQFVDEVLVERLARARSPSVRTSASARARRATPRCSPPTGASRRASWRCARSTARSSPRARSAR